MPLSLSLCSSNFQDAHAKTSWGLLMHPQTIVGGIGCLCYPNPALLTGRAATNQSLGAEHISYHLQSHPFPSCFPKVLSFCPSRSHPDSFHLSGAFFQHCLGDIFHVSCPSVPRMTPWCLFWTASLDLSSLLWGDRRKWQLGINMHVPCLVRASREDPRMILRLTTEKRRLFAT